MAVERRTDFQWDVFISHASEDKDSLVRPLADALQAQGLNVWFDEFTLTVGDRLRRKIDHGLANSRFGVVVLSPYFFSKAWPQDELDGLDMKERMGEKVILPVWHDIELHEVAQFSPMLAGRLAAHSNQGIDHVVKELLKAMQISPGRKPWRDAHLENPIWPEFLLKPQPIKQYYRRPDISLRRLDNAQRRCRVPATDKVVALIDVTDSVLYWNWGKQALVFGEAGIYFGDRSESGFFTYEESQDHHFSHREEKIPMGKPGQYGYMYHIQMPTGTLSYMSAFWLPSPDSVVTLLSEIGQYRP